MEKAMEEILAQEQKLTQATRRLDIQALDDLYADDIMFTTVPGTVCRKDTLIDEARRGREESAKRPEGSSVSYEKEDMQVVVHGDTAVTSYRFIVEFSIPGQETITNRFRTTNVWMKGPAGWQVVAAHTSKI